ncbi:MAG: hypothetical protein KF703_16365 [Actinobacteria bacterium]|nr:hypothetical protein [Actinomycetota bacterium]
MSDRTLGSEIAGFFEASAEHRPMSGLDELMVHNHPHPLRVMWTGDSQAYERIWFTAQDHVGELMVVAGMGMYPNLGTAEAFAIVNCRGRHTTVRAHRKLGDNRVDMTVGPIGFELVEPFRQWHLWLDENEHGTAFDLRWHDTKRPIYRQLGLGTIVGGRPFEGVAGYDGFGRQEGWVSVGDERFEVTQQTYCGTRDHHWGVRDGVGGPGMYRGGQHPHSGEWVEFEDFGLWGDHLLYPLGDERRRSGTLRGREHRMRFEPDTHLLLSGEVDLIHDDGRVQTMTFERLGNQTAYLRCGMYGGPNGGTPDGDLWHGMAVGDGVVSGETYDANDPAVRARICGLDQHHARFELDGEVAYGIVEPYDTLCYQLCQAGRLGFSLLD